MNSFSLLIKLNSISLKHVSVFKEKHIIYFIYYIYILLNDEFGVKNLLGGSSVIKPFQLSTHINLDTV